LASRIGIDPWLIGIFVNNELGWGSGPDAFARDLLAADKECTGKSVYIESLKREFRQDIMAFNRSVGVSAASWDDLLQLQFKGTVNMAPLKKINIDHYKRMCELYFSINREAIDEFMPGTLYLGCRWHGNNGNEYSVEIGSRYLDVLSFNRYDDTVEKFNFPGRSSEIDKPFLVSEFHFGAYDRGHFGPGLHYAADQRNRGEKYQHFVESAIGNPKCVGAHWFMWMDESAAGFKNGENFNCGLVSITDRPYTELISYARQIHSTIYPRMVKQ
jgi:hypothetical protein